ncbi:MAG: hypothetical protein IKY94_14510 [Lachnospiraceae bacterium]|nr:hypothetical protein [Lachnospiraceae bacterium]
MNSLFQGFLNAIKAKIVPLWTKIRLLTNPTYLKTESLRRLIIYFRNLTDIRPRDKQDYYGVFGWMVSKRLAFFIVAFVGLASAVYLTQIQPLSVFTSDKTGVKTYSYNSIPLRFTKGNVRILGKSKYLAYEGNVEKGRANGIGVLYRKDGTKVYEGSFENSQFQGNGVTYYPTEQIQYKGSFGKNLYNGSGELYRKNGSLEYKGAFLNGMKEGEGILYDSGNNPVYKGNFSKNQLMYSEFVGKSTAEVNSIYVGKKTIYTDEEYFVVDMSDIDAVYYGKQQEENLSDEVAVEGVYVLKNTFEYSGEKSESVYQIREIMGEPIYEGNAYLILPEAVAIHILNGTGNDFYGEVLEETQQILADAININAYDEEYSVYIYSYVQDGLRYTFFGKDRSGKFAMYLIEKEE